VKATAAELSIFTRVHPHQVIIALLMAFDYDDN